MASDHVYIYEVRYSYKSDDGSYSIAPGGYLFVVHLLIITNLIVTKQQTLSGDIIEVFEIPAGHTYENPETWIHDSYNRTTKQHISVVPGNYIKFISSKLFMKQ